MIIRRAGYGLLLAGLGQLIDASPTLSFPFNSQCPPVARVGQDYQYQLLLDTFSSSDPSSLQYCAQDLPDWLSFDGSTRTFSGTPPQSAIPNNQNNQTIQFNIIATDSTGNTSSLNTSNNHHFCSTTNLIFKRAA